MSNLFHINLKFFVTALPLKDNLKKLLKEQDITVSQLERKANIKEQSLQNVIRGISKNPSIELVYAISKALDVNVEDLVSTQADFSVSNYDSYSEICIKVIEEIKKTTKKPTPQKKIFRIIEEVFLYTTNMKADEVDPSFIKWTVMKNFE